MTKHTVGKINFDNTKAQEDENLANLGKNLDALKGIDQPECDRSEYKKSALENAIKFLKDKEDEIESFIVVIKKRADFDTQVKTSKVSEVDALCYGDAFELTGVLELAKIKLLESKK